MGKSPANAEQHRADGSGRVLHPLLVRRVRARLMRHQEPGTGDRRVGAGGEDRGHVAELGDATCGQDREATELPDSRQERV